MEGSRRRSAAALGRRPRARQARGVEGGSREWPWVVTQGSRVALPLAGSRAIATAARRHRQRSQSWEAAGGPEGAPPVLRRRPQAAAASPVKELGWPLGARVGPVPTASGANAARWVPGANGRRSAESACRPVRARGHRQPSASVAVNTELTTVGPPFLRGPGTAAGPLRGGRGYPRRKGARRTRRADWRSEESRGGCPAGVSLSFLLRQAHTFDTV